MNGPDRDQALVKYRKVAPRYDARTRFYARYGGIAVERLALTRGDRVVDVACGTGANFKYLIERVSPAGQVVGVDLSPDMLEVARARVRRHGWSNVSLVEAAVEEAELPGQLDGALFSLTHDVLQSQPAVDNVVHHLRPGGRIATFGAKQPQRFRRLLWPVVRRIADRYVTTFESIDQPWRLLQRQLADLRVREVLWGCAYLAWGTVSGSSGPPEDVQHSACVRAVHDDGRNQRRRCHRTSKLARDTALHVAYAHPHATRQRNPGR
jgi:ubiquinone/menaquinone biosynthesis C-methylase UbiE